MFLLNIIQENKLFLDKNGDVLIENLPQMLEDLTNYICLIRKSPDSCLMKYRNLSKIL